MPAAERWAEVEQGVANRTSGLPIGLGMRGLGGASPEAEMTESRAQRPTIDQIEDRVSVVKQLRERFKEDKVYLRTLDADLLCLQMTLNWRRGEQKS